VVTGAGCAGREPLPHVISSQVVTETISTLTRKYGFTLMEAHEVALSLLDLCELVPVGARTIVSWAQPFPRTWMLRPSATIVGHRSPEGKAQGQAGHPVPSRNIKKRARYRLRVR
jgi:hypothetical protein